MKILYCLRIDAYDRYGGDVLHAEKVAAAVRSLGVEAEVSTQLEPDLTGVDLVHLFNMDWVRDPLVQARYVKRQNQGIPILLTPIHHNFREIDEFENKERYGLGRLVNPIFPSYYQRETLKNIYRAFVEMDRRKWRGTVRLLNLGLKKAYVELLEMSDLLLPNTHLEVQEIEREFQVSRPTMVVPAGVEKAFANSTPEWFQNNYSDVAGRLGNSFALMVGRVEPRKNQLRVIQAANTLKIPLLLVGRFNKHHPEYSYRVRREIEQSDNIEHIENVPYERMGSVMSCSRCHILASWFETTGLVNLEAALSGANVVTTSKGFGSEYVKDFAYYVDPSDEASIRKNVKRAMEVSFDENFRQYVLSHFTWERVGELTKKAYEKVLSK